MNKDLTVGKEEVVLCKFALPLFLSIIFQQMYNICDSLIAGKYVGNIALAAVGNSYEITLIYLAFAFGCNIGCSVVVSEFYGARKNKELKSAVSTTFIASGILCITLMILGFALGPAMLRMIHTKESVFNDSLIYLNIYTGGLLFLFFYNIATGIFSALGDSKTPFIFLAASSSANVICDYAFVRYLDMGVAGVAWATFICQGASCILSLLAVIKRLKKLECEEKPEAFSRRMLKKLSFVAIPSILQQSFISVGNIIIQGIINDFGPNATAGYAAAVKLNNMVITSFTTIGNAMSNFTAQNLGAGKPGRIKKGLRGGLILVYSLSLIAFVLFFFKGAAFVDLFMKEAKGEATGIGVDFLRIVAPFYFVVATKLVCDGVLRGAGVMKLFMIATFTDLILRVLFAIILSKSFATTGIWMAWPVGWCIATVLSVIFYLRKQKDNFISE